MNDPLVALLDQLEHALAADAGVALLLTDTEDVLQVRATSGGVPASGAGRWVARLATGVGLWGGRSSIERVDPDAPGIGSQLLLAVPDGRSSLLVMARRSREMFSAQDRALARLYARQVAAELGATHARVVADERTTTSPRPATPAASVTSTGGAALPGSATSAASATSRGTATSPRSATSPGAAASTASAAAAPAATSAEGPGPTWTHDLRTIQSIAAQLTRLTTAARIGEVICRETRRVVPADSCRVYVLARDGVTLEPVAWAHFMPQYADEDADTIRLRLGQGITGSAVEAGEGIIVSDASRHPAAIPVPGTELIEEAMLVAPLRYEGMPRGAIVLSRVGRVGFGQDELRLVQVLADQAVVAFENARSLADRDRAVQELEALLRISNAGSMEQDEAQLSELVARTIQRSIGVDAVAVSRLGESSPARLDLLAQEGSLPGTVDRSEVDLTTSTQVRQALIDGQPRLLHARVDRGDAGDLGALRRLGVRQCLVLPLVAASRTIGLLELYLVQDDRVLTEHEVALVRTMGGQAAASLQNVRLLTQLREAADIDQLTGVHNHRYLQERLTQEVARSSRSRTPLSVMLVDLDGFKTINDQHGHADGDRVLQNVAATLRMAVRTNDIVARYGGDEFVVVMPDTALDAARHVADRVVAGVRGLRHQLSDGSEGRVACSAGLAVAPDDGRTAQKLLRAADAAMYRAKRGGGDSVLRAESGRTTITAPRPARS
ncbi:MAG: diguanylate cyclase [Chloroflexi bacterium]|nr:diguanylate cyclase [Chloroflexota bacterium]